MKQVWLFILATSSVSAHIALWDKGMFGLNYPGQSTDDVQNYNSNDAVHPLRAIDNLLINDWFAHGYKDYPPPPGDFMVLESGGVFHGELACNRAFTKCGDPAVNTPQPRLACEEGVGGAMHTRNRKGSAFNPAFASGTALAIAYTSDQANLRPEHMTVISVDYASVWLREVTYSIPKHLPECPPGGCLCTWNWIHQAGHDEGYADEIYNNLYRCKVTGQINNDNIVAKGQVPSLCEDAPETCVRGAKLPMYLYQKEGNNMNSDGLKDPPSYNARYGFTDGPQDTAIARKQSKEVGRRVAESAETLSSERQMRP